MTINSKQKGKRFERELSKMFKSYGYETRRGQQYCGSNGDADVVGAPGLHIEAKHQETMRLYDWIAQAKHDAKKDLVPAVFHRKNNHEVLVTMTFPDFMKLYAAYERELWENGRKG